MGGERSEIVAEYTTVKHPVSRDLYAVRRAGLIGGRITHAAGPVPKADRARAATVIAWHQKALDEGGRELGAWLQAEIDAHKAELQPAVEPDADATGEEQGPCPICGRLSSEGNCENGC